MVIVMANERDDSRRVLRRNLALPRRSTTNGRGHGEGEWLEYECERALHRWGYTTDRRVEVFDMELDVVARRKHPHNRPSDYVVAECKDWADTPIPPAVIHRLCMLAFTCQAVPLLCHTTTLTRRAAKLAKYWEVRVVTYPDLQRGSLPGPQVVDFTGRTYDPITAQHSIRDQRGPLPPMFQDRDHAAFSYVPGYQPRGKHGKYEPTVIDQRRTTEPE